MSDEITIKTLHEILIRVEEHVEKINGRLRALENWRSFLAGGLAILTFSIPLIIKFL